MRIGDRGLQLLQFHLAPSEVAECELGSLSDAALPGWQWQLDCALMPEAHLHASGIITQSSWHCQPGEAASLTEPNPHSAPSCQTVEAESHDNIIHVTQHGAAAVTAGLGP